MEIPIPHHSLKKSAMTISHPHFNWQPSHFFETLLVTGAERPVDDAQKYKQANHRHHTAQDREIHNFPLLKK